MFKSARYLIMSSTLVASLVWLSACGEQKAKERPARTVVSNQTNPGQPDALVTPLGVNGVQIQTSGFTFSIDSIEFADPNIDNSTSLPVTVSTKGTFAVTSSTPESVQISTSHTSVGAEVIDGSIALKSNNYISYMGKCVGNNCEIYYLSAIVITLKADGSLSEVRQYGFKRERGYSVYTFTNKTNVSHHIDDLIPMIDTDQNIVYQNMP